MDSPASIPDVCEVELVCGADADTGGPADLLFEVPHGATTARHFEAIRSRLVGELSDDLAAFFFVNTDVGAFECAVRTAELVVGRRSTPLLVELLADAPSVDAARCRSLRVRIVRCLLPRTFVDCNRVLENPGTEPGMAGMTEAIPVYVDDPRDRSMLSELHRAYQAVAAQAYDDACGNGGSAVMFHTYAPKDVDVEVDRDVVAALRRAYSPENYGRWRARPEVDLISEASDGTKLASRGLVEAVRDSFAAIGMRPTENATYRLHPATLGHRHSAAYPDRVLCLEINRGLLADPFSPFEEMRIGDANVDRMATPIAAACLRALAGPAPARL